MLDYGEHGDVESLLARAFIADAVADLGAKLLGREAVWGVDAGVLADALPFVEEHRSPEFLESVAATLERSGTGPSHLPDDFQLAAETFHRFAEDKIRPVAEHIHRTNADIPEDLIQGLAELGGFGLSVPETYDGFASGGEADYLGMVVATEELSWGSLGVGGSLITRPEILTRAIVAGGTDAQKRRWLPGIAAGEQMVGVTVTEPDFGSDVAGVSTMATPVDGGYRINGVKTWATFAGRANLLMLLARTDPDKSLSHRGLSLFVVEKDAVPGHSFALEQPEGGKLDGRAIDTIGYRGMHSYEVSFSDWFVPADNLVGEEGGLGKGFYLQMEGFENGRLQTAARAVGLMQAAFDAGLAYARERIVFGKPVFDYELSRMKLARMAALDPGRTPVLLRRRPPHGSRRRHAGGVDGEGLRVPLRRVGHARGDAAPRRHGLRRGVPGVALLRRRPRAVDLRGRRRDPVPARHRPAPRRAGALGDVAPTAQPSRVLISDCATCPRAHRGSRTSAPSCGSLRRSSRRRT